MMFSAHGMGAYPTDSYYDPDRPSWLPYWFDDPTESAQKYGMFGKANVNATYPNPSSPVPPVVQPDLTGQSVNIDKQISDTAAANNNQTQTFFNNLADTLPNSTVPNNQNSSIGVMWLYIGVGALVFVALKK